MALALLGLNPNFKWLPDAPLLALMVPVPLGLIGVAGLRAGGLLRGAAAGLVAGAMGGAAAGACFLAFNGQRANLVVAPALGALGGVAIGAVAGLAAGRRART